MHRNESARAPGLLPITGGDLIHHLFARYGGLAYWRSISQVDVEFSAGGLAFALKGQWGSLGGLHAQVHPSAQQVRLRGFPRSGYIGTFMGDAVRIAKEDGSDAIERVNPRQLFPGVRRRLWWDALDLLYFTGYALWHYVCFPFVLATPGTVLREIEPSPDSELRCLQAVFPPTLHAHCSVNRYYIDGDFLLRRHHYTAEVIGKFAKAAHLCGGYRQINGLPVATRRVVLPEYAGYRNLPLPQLVWIRIDDVCLRHGPPEGS